MSKRKVKVVSTGKRETIEEFLQRGGQITKIPSAPTPEGEHVVSPATSNSTMMTLSGGALFYSESKIKEQKKPVEQTINREALPAHLLKYMPKQNN